MSTRHLLLIAVAGTIAISGRVSVAAAQPAARPPLVMPPQVPPAAIAPPPNPLPPGPRPPISRSLPTFSPPAPASVAKPAQARSPDPPPITFFLASGPADACGAGCDGWIAADGKIDLEAAQRLRKVLAKLGQRRVPLYLHSAGGSVLGAIELGRLIRRHNITVSVARTLPAECPRDPQPNKACETLKRSGRDLVSELDTSRGICNSACVLVLAGGAVRSVPPWVRLGVHAIGFDLTKTPVRGPALAAATRAANARIVEYLHDMAIPKALFDASNAVPHESPRFLQRDELVRFGLDTRAFGESDWRFTEKPSMAVAKGFFIRTGDASLAYPEALLRLSCSAGNGISLTFARERAASAPGSRPVRVTVNGIRIDLPYASQAQAGKIEIRTAALGADAIAAASDGDAVEISGFDGAADVQPQDNKAGDDHGRNRIVLNMAGFSAAYAKLRKACDAQASAHSACGAEMSPRCMPEAIQTWHGTPSSAGGPAWPPP